MLDGEPEGAPERVIWHVSSHGNNGYPWFDAQSAYFLDVDHELTAVDRAAGTVRWSVKLPVTRPRTVGFGGAVVDSLVLVGDQDLFALQRKDGAIVWRFAPSQGVDVGRLPPIVWNDLVLAGSSNGYVFAADLASGALRWATRLVTRENVGVWLAPIADGILYAGVTDFVGAANGEPQGSIAALNASSGTVLWHEPLPHHVSPTGPTATIFPAVAGSVVVAGARDGPVYAFDRMTGQQRWKLPPFPFPHVTDPALIRDIHVFAACDGMLVVGSTSTIVAALDADTGAERWRTPRSAGSVNWVGCDDRAVYVYRPFGVVEALDRVTGERRWAITEGYDFITGVAVDGDRLYAGGPSGLYALRND